MIFKFNVGDKVRYTGDYNKVEEDSYLRNCVFLTINKRFNLFGVPFYEVAEGEGDVLNENVLELVKKAENIKLKYKKPTKKELLNMPKGTKIYTDAKTDNEYVYDGDIFYSKHRFLYKGNISDSLKIININYPDSPLGFGTHITKIIAPISYETVYEEDLAENLYNDNDWLRKRVKELEQELLELQKKLKQTNIDAEISKQEQNIIDMFFGKE